MKTALVISSFVGAGHVGASVSAFCLQRLGVDVLTLPTTLFGRHPGWGPPGGQAVSENLILDMWQGLRAQNIKIDAVLTGYMASAAQVKTVSKIIRDVRADNIDAQIIVDPVMGDHGQLYVPKDVAAGIIDALVTQADIITPNLWEMGYMCQSNLGTLQDLTEALKTLNTPALISSVPVDGDIGAVFYDKTSAHLVRHTKFKTVPHGGGDALAGTFTAHLLQGETRPTALARSVASIFDILSNAAAQGLPDIPLIQFQDRLLQSPPLNLESLSLD